MFPWMVCGYSTHFITAPRADRVVVDPPFFQKQSESSNEEINPARETAYSFPSAYQQVRPTMPAHSSSADDYRSVIDDLTVENKRLKEELKRYRQFGPDLLRKDKLFEIKVHGLPKKKKRELEATLRDFASSLEGSATSSQQRKKVSKHVGRLQGSSSNSKHASSSSSHGRPVDSAYASMSTGPSSIGPNASLASFGRPSLGRVRASAEQKVESYLDDIPEGLFPRQIALTDKEKKKLVVRRLEQLFTGKVAERAKSIRSNQQIPSILEPQISAGGVVSAPPQLLAAPQTEASREARIQLELGKKSQSREELSVSNSTGENDTCGNRTGSGSGSNEHSGQDNSPQTADPPEQRATRPLDLDPDRIQNPSENMQYIRHLGVTAPEYLSQTRYRPQDVSIDAEGWIHLNLLCNLAQLHIFNVTPDYIRSAVSERSTKFQLSRDGRKIRWRGGTEGTKFSSDSSGDSSQRSPDTEATDGSNEGGQRKKQKTGAQTSANSTKSQKKLGPQAPAPSEGFHYKPMFIHHQSSSIETSMDETASQPSFGVVDRSNLNSRSTGVSGSGSSPRKKRRRDGAIIYYTGAPFCLDLSGDPIGDMSPTTYITSSGQEESSLRTEEEKPALVRSASGSSLAHRPLVDEQGQMNVTESEYICPDTDMSEDEDFVFPWCENPQKPQLKPLEARFEPCGLGGVTPEDHFAILVVTHHPLNVRVTDRPGIVRLGSDETTDSIASRIAGLVTSSPHPRGQISEYRPHIQIQVIQQRYKELKPLPLPPPAIFYPPFTETTESEDSGFEDDYADEEDDSEVIINNSDKVMSQRANPYQSDNEISRMRSLESNGNDVGFISRDSNLVSKVKLAPAIRKLSRGSSQRPGVSISKGAEIQPDSSGATAGGEASGYSSSEEEST